MAWLQVASIEDYNYILSAGGTKHYLSNSSCEKLHVTKM